MLCCCAVLFFTHLVLQMDQIGIVVGQVGLASVPSGVAHNHTVLEDAAALVEEPKIEKRCIYSTLCIFYRNSFLTMHVYTLQRNKYLFPM